MPQFKFLSYFLLYLIFTITHGNSQDNPLIEAFKKNNYDQVRQLLNENKYINVPDPYNNWTPIFYATTQAGLESYLKSEKKNKNSEGQSFIEYKQHFHEIVNMLLEKGAKINVFDKIGKSPLYYAVFNDDSILVNQFLDKGVGIEDSEELFLLASKYGFIRIVSNLLENKLDPCDANKEGFGALHLAAMNGKLNTFSILSSNTTNIDCKTKPSSGYFSELTSLQLACMNGQVQVIPNLLSKGALLEVKMKDGKNLLHLAAMGARFEVSSYSKKGEIEMEDIVLGGNINLVQFIDSVKPNLHEYDQIGANPLHYACYYRKLPLAVELFNQGELPVIIKSTCEHSFASALSQILFKIEKDTNSFVKSEFDIAKNLILIAKKKYQDSLTKVNNKIVSSDLLNILTVALTFAGGGLIGLALTYGDIFSEIECPVIHSYDLKSIKKYLKAQITICDNFLVLMDDKDAIQNKNIFYEKLISILNVKELMSKEQ
ncbi:MAG: ankyrin repeat domain-containing protein [Saprospiraceae bacterium]